VAVALGEGASSVRGLMGFYRVNARRMQSAFSHNAHLLSVCHLTGLAQRGRLFSSIRPVGQCILQYGKEVMGTLAQHLCMAIYSAGVGVSSKCRAWRYAFRAIGRGRVAGNWASRLTRNPRRHGCPAVSAEAGGHTPVVGRTKGEFPWQTKLEQLNLRAGQ
jgi:hypothetical protein